jgi:pSer/pThr/pTyr-binding forkhead associated (FHA) protein
VKGGLIFVEQAPLTGRVVQLAPVVSIGREGCDVVLPDPEVSRRHARLFVDGGVAMVEDLGSTNGTWLNGAPVADPAPVAPGDVLRFGNTVWDVRFSGAETRVGGERPAGLPPEP